MAGDDRDILEVLKFELDFLEQGGYGRSPHNPRRAPLIFEDSPSCLNFDDEGRPHSCDECLLTGLVPKAAQSRPLPCRHVELDAKGRTIDDFYRNGTQAELEEALAGWLRRTIARIEAQRKAAAQKAS